MAAASRTSEELLYASSLPPISQNTFGYGFDSSSSGSDSRTLEIPPYRPPQSPFAPQAVSHNRLGRYTELGQSPPSSFSQRGYYSNGAIPGVLRRSPELSSVSTQVRGRSSSERIPRGEHVPYGNTFAAMSSSHEKPYLLSSLDEPLAVSQLLPFAGTPGVRASIACEACRKRKVRCQVINDQTVHFVTGSGSSQVLSEDDTGKKCQRCLKLGKDCVWKFEKKTKNRPNGQAEVPEMVMQLGSNYSPTREDHPMTLSRIPSSSFANDPAAPDVIMYTSRSSGPGRSRSHSNALSAISEPMSLTSSYGSDMPSGASALGAHRESSLHRWSDASASSPSASYSPMSFSGPGSPISYRSTQYPQQPQEISIPPRNSGSVSLQRQQSFQEYGFITSDSFGESRRRANTIDHAGQYPHYFAS